ncbi:hypothetical protein CPC16_010294 [Podila verticillata]|nr:hypothetical protein BGZ52_008316 [Haplosporangium bisporale]KAF9380489.1 hypothetical protein CPC16_010294 [Podila verticillata]KAI9232901.1 MAG: coth protein-domain-containing protein [Podila humilis]
MKYYSLALVASLASSALAAQVKFSVIAPGGSNVQVSVNGQNVALTAADPTVPVFTGTAETGSDTKYKYVVAGKTEPFDRALPTGASTYNDFFDRPVTYANIPELPWPIEKDPQWTRSGPKQSLFDTNYIPTVFVNGNAAELDGLVATPTSTKYGVTLTLVLADQVKTFTGVQFGIHGAGKKKNNAKQSWNWRLKDGESFANRDFFKLRHMEEDPTQIREKLYADVARALGTYANEANMVRMFINGEGFGTFNLLDDIKEYSFPKAMFYNGQPPAQMGALFDGGSGASFAYDPTGMNYYNWVMNPTSPETPLAVDPLCKAINDAVKTDDAAWVEIDKLIDTDQFMRFMVMEYLTGHWDGYWEMQTNDGLYRDPTQNNKWYYIGQDFDATFGVNIPTADTTFPEWSYTKYPTAFPNAVLINGLLQNANQKAKFETYLKKTVEVLFNNVTLTNRVLKYHEFILPDLAWDRNITQRSPGINFNWQFNQVTENLWGPVSSITNTGGGAMYGLIEWIVKKSTAVAAEHKITITSQPVGPPVASKPPTGGNADNGNGNGNNNNNNNNNGAGTAKPTGDGKASGAGNVAPKAMAAVAVVGSLVALMF